MAVFILSYATEDFLKWQKELNESAEAFGIKNILSYTREDLVKTSFYKEHREILDLPRGGGYWLWKPYYILQTLQSLQEGDILLYADSGCKLISSPEPLISICRENMSGIVAFDAYPLRNSQLTKRDAFVNMDCDDELYWNATHVIATTIIFRKSQFVLDFVTEWLFYCCNIHNITDVPNVSGKENLPDFFKHQGDQPIFSILIKKYQIETYRNPSVNGNFLKMKDYRKKGEIVCYPYYFFDKKITYSENSRLNSPFDTIFEFNRARVKPKRTLLDKFKRKIKTLLQKKESINT